MPRYKIKAVFQVKPDVDSDTVLFEYENDEVETDDKYEHSALFGEGHKLAHAYVKEHRNGIVVRIVTRTEVFSDYSIDGAAYVSVK